MKETDYGRTVVCEPLRSVSFRLPWPPSLNHAMIYPTRAAPYPSKAGKAFRADAIAAVWSHFQGKPTPLRRCRVTLKLTPPTKAKRDADNHIKPVLDALVDAGLLGDDSAPHVKEVRAAWTDRVEKPGCCDVTIAEIKPTHGTQEP